MDPTLSQALPYLIPLAVLALVLRRSLRGRQLNADRLWLLPVVLLLVGGSSLLAAPPRHPVGIAAVLAALALGAGAGWWRGRLTHITIDPKTHVLTSRTSVVGVVLIGALFLIRYGMRMVSAANPGAIPGGAGLATESLLVFGIAMMAVQRLEMWLRCRRLIAEARSASA